jgi:hypothetical protein
MKRLGLLVVLWFFWVPAIASAEEDRRSCTFYFAVFEGYGPNGGQCWTGVDSCGTYPIGDCMPTY